MTTWNSQLTFKFRFVYSECASVPKLFLSNNIHNFLPKQSRGDNHVQTIGIFLFLKTVSSVYAGSKWPTDLIF